MVNEPIFDFHCHLESQWFDHALMDRATFLEGLDRCGVRRACIFTVMGFYGESVAANDRLAATAAEAPGRLIPFATVDPKQGEAAVKELSRCLERGVFRGVKFHPWMQSFASTMVWPTMNRLLGLAADHGVPVLFHDGTPPYSTTFQIAALARRSPRTTVVLGHGGLADYTEAAAQLAAEIANLHVCTCCPKAGDIQYLVQRVGPEKVLFGSDFGVAGWRVLAERLDDLAHAGLSEAARGMVLWQNAERLLRLETSDA
ncbi:amidohydrolase family protein [Phycisphaerales bacterium AB-hyl4]|uniref:Amidohydrolase family protein n=1 Tax=Natronomicrosphaera hydrolytica TaxID=3242702 RepID=A0ABV4UBG5_9BACT